MRYANNDKASRLDSHLSQVPNTVIQFQRGGGGYDFVDHAVSPCGKSQFEFTLLAFATQ